MTPTCCGRGAQGESDAGLTFLSPAWAQYRLLLQAMVAGWRADLVKPLRRPALPFIIVQLQGALPRYSKSAGLLHRRSCRPSCLVS